MNNDGLTSVERLSVRFDDLVGLDGDLLVEFLSVAVMLVDTCGNFLGLDGVVGDKQFNGFLSGFHTSGSVDAWSDFKDDVADAKRFA